MDAVAGRIGSHATDNTDGHSRSPTQEADFIGAMPSRISFSQSWKYGGCEAIIGGRKRGFRAFVKWRSEGGQVAKGC